MKWIKPSGVYLWLSGFCAGTLFEGMGGQKFQYDESGGTFFYFLLSFLALLLIPGTYYWWPRKQKVGRC